MVKAEHIIQEFPELKQKKVYLAISGGLDSVVLMHLLLDSHISPTLLHCNFNLRGKESNDDELFIQELADKKGVNLIVKTFDADKIASEENSTIQETARKLRYNWFNDIVENEALLLTGHHLDDNIETFFINLLRGTGLKGLCGIPKKRGNILRPLLTFEKSALLNYAKKNGLYWREDSSNKSKKYLRNRMRQELIPLLNELDTDFQKKISRTISSLRQTDNFLTEQVDSVFEKEKREKKFSIEKIEKQPTTLLRKFLENYGVHRTNYGAFEKFISSHSGSKFYTKEFEFVKTQNEVFVRKKRKTKSLEVTISELPFSCSTEDFNLRLDVSDDTTINTQFQQLDLDKVRFPLTLRYMQKGDRIRPLGLNGSKLVSKILIEANVNAFDKEKQLLIQDATKDIICLLGICIAEKVKLTKDARTAVSVIKN